jgi:hypothetical protein
MQRWEINAALGNALALLQGEAGGVVTTRRHQLWRFFNAAATALNCDVV